jgi:competence protein ComEA
MKQNQFFNKILSNIKEKFGITNAEFFVVLILALCLSISVIYKSFFRDKISYGISAANLISASDFNNILDSISEVNQTTFIGSNADNEPVPELEKADTLVKETKKSPQKKSDFKGIININTASKTQLKQLYRIGEKTAEAIMEYRKSAKFEKKEDIMKVKGIGEKTYENIKNNIKISD